MSRKPNDVKKKKRKASAQEDSSSGGGDPHSPAAKEKDGPLNLSFEKGSSHSNQSSNFSKKGKGKKYNNNGFYHSFNNGGFYHPFHQSNQNAAYMRDSYHNRASAHMKGQMNYFPSQDLNMGCDAYMGSMEDPRSFHQWGADWRNASEFYPEIQSKNTTTSTEVEAEKAGGAGGSITSTSDGRISKSSQDGTYREACRQMVDWYKLGSFRVTN